MYSDGGNGGASNPWMEFDLFSGNRAGSAGGGMYNNGGNSGSSLPTLINVTFSGKPADVSGGGMYSYGVAGNARPRLVNCILWGNEPQTARRYPTKARLPTSPIRISKAEATPIQETCRPTRCCRPSPGQHCARPRPAITTCKPGRRSSMPAARSARPRQRPGWQSAVDRRCRRHGGI